MKLLAQSDLRNYSSEFWERESRKSSKLHVTFDDPVGELRLRHDYKLPKALNKSVWIAEVESPDEVLGLRIHKYMLTDHWMTQRNLVQPSDRLGDIARTAIERGYFTNPASKGDRQVFYYNKWKSEKSLVSVLESEEKPLIEISGGSYEIVDGWGRLLPMASVLLEGVQFSLFKVYLAKP